MSIPFLTAIDLNQNELLNVRLQNLASAPGSPSDGRIYYDTTAGQLAVRENGAWVSYAADDHTHNFWDGPEHDAHDHSAALASAALFDLGNVGGTAPTDQQALLWSDSNSRWEAGTVATSTPPIGNLADVTITSVADNEVLAYNTGTGQWINQTASEAGLATDTHVHAASEVTSGTFNDSRIAQSNVTQHQAALSITESQISDLTHLTIEEVQDNLGTSFIVGGTNLNATYNDVGNTLTLDVTGVSTTGHTHTEANITDLDHLTLEEVQDNLGNSVIVGGSNISSTYNDTAGTITLAVTTAGLDADTLDGNEATAFQLVSEKGNANGYASLDGGGKVPSAQLPALALSEVFVVADITARNALTVQEGDVAIVTGTSETYIYDGTAWQEMVSPTDGVTAVTGGTGITSSGGTTPEISITAGGVGSTQLATNAVTNAKMADNAINTAEIVDGAVTEAKLAFTRTKRVSGLMGDGAATAFTITHNLGTRDVIAMVYEAASPYAAVMVDIAATTTNSTTFTFASAPALNEYRYVLIA